ncbi:MAG TPA: Ig domain-containing protein [Candidatus Sulfotelmatobacter sp.]|nr:Ig domain-containing protein [Candidatus Sulfotelmatobacter sp.]
MTSFRHHLANDIAVIPAPCRLLSVVPLLALLAATVACSNVLPSAPSNSATSKPQSPSHIVLTPTSASVSSGGTLQFSALIQNSSNTHVQWSTSAGTISTDGLFYAPTVTSPQTVTVSVGSPEPASTSVLVMPRGRLTISTQSLQAATRGVSYSQLLSSSGGTAPYSWSISSGMLPAGMQLNASTGVIAGATIQIGTFPFTVMVRDASSDQASQPLTLVVSSVSSTPCLSGPPTYSCSSISTANPGTISPIFASTAPTATTCIGMCQNSTAYDTTLNPQGTDCITRISDGTTFPNGLSMGNLTFSGGDNDIMGSVNETYLGINTDQVYILHMNTSGNCIQVENTGTPGIHVAGPFGFSKVIDTRFYYLVNQTQLWQGDITSDTTFTPTKLVDIFAPGVCPGISPFATSSASIMGISQTDERFGWSVGPGGQGSADWAFVWDRNLGCASVNLATGSYWDFCSGSSCGPSTPSSGRLASTGCYGSQGSIMHGIHDSQMSGDGNWMIFAMQVTGSSNVGWSHGACAGSLLSNQQMIWHVGTNGSQWAYSNPSLGFGGSDSGSHNSAGVSSYLTPFYNGPNARDFSNVTTFTQFAPPVITTDVHCSWPHPLNDDSYPWVCASDLVTPEQGGNLAPMYLSNVVYAWFPNTTHPSTQAPTLFSHTFSCGAGTSTCPGGGDVNFGAQQSIGVATQKGNYFCWASTHLHNLGKDNLGNPRADGFCVHLQ